MLLQTTRATVYACTECINNICAILVLDGGSQRSTKTDENKLSVAIHARRIDQRTIAVFMEYTYRASGKDTIMQGLLKESISWREGGGALLWLGLK